MVCFIVSLRNLSWTNRRFHSFILSLIRAFICRNASNDDGFSRYSANATYAWNASGHDADAIAHPICGAGSCSGRRSSGGALACGAGAVRGR